jgi:hypothetical protein
MDDETLLAIIRKCGWQGAWQDQVRGLLSKLTLLEGEGRYGRLLANLVAANDKNNFVASVLEATIAFQFESAGIKLDYEIRQDPDSNSSIDFCWKTAVGKTVYFEVRLLQQDRATSDSIQRQLQIGNVYAVSKDGEDEKQDIVRVQQAILEKVQKKDGTPTKFLTTHEDAINIVAVDISQIILGTFDPDDCRLVTLGDPSVQPVNQRGIFGIFQAPLPAYPEYIQSLAKSYPHIRRTLHGVLFLFKHPKSELFNYSVSRLLAWNPTLVDEETARAICTEIERALPLIKQKK